MIRRLPILLALAAIFMIATVGSVSAASADSMTDKVIQASGSGNVIGTPDRAQVTFSVQTENADVKVAQADNAARMTKVIDALVAAGIPRDALKTTGYNIYTVYEDYSSGILNPKVKAYRVTNTLTVTLHDVSRTGEVIDIAVANGVNQADSIQFMLSDAQSLALRSEALKKAVANARADAEAVAGAMGVNITGTGNVNIYQGYMPVAYSNYQADSAMGAKSAVATPIQSGDITVTAQVSVTYTYN
ncbi:MAG: SIMPL domain-containing protein [Methanoregula sp.]|uniref:SIMPL domain-containing protein n=1 Tax=Methanoregula sp. TaxID=2052170 RepID=UPI0025D15A67|nr:SIMPL domain-containing protein [Methanoregula sp.]MCK9630494.1 SIMPL domain-containing protein [Methanoregula sp.]